MEEVVFYPAKKIDIETTIESGNIELTINEEIVSPDSHKVEISKYKIESSIVEEL